MVSHGIPYMALIYLNDKKKQHQFISFLFFEGARGNAFYWFCAFIAFAKNILEILVWNEQFAF
jgi:hypothetical protein